MPLYILRKFVKMAKATGSASSSSGFDLDLGLLSCHSLTTDSTKEAIQTLVDGLFALPRDDDAFTVTLPDPKLILPRMYPLPKEKVETRWEKFAREKGIQNRKKERMVFDEVSQTWKPRYGYGRAIGTGNNEAPIMELKATDSNDVDPFERARDKRQLKQLKQQKNELKNTDRREKAHGRKDLGLAGLPSGKHDEKLKRNLEKNKKVLKTVQTSTRSYGRFDEKVKNEPERKIEDKRRKFAPNMTDSKSEKERALKILKRMAS